MIENVLCTIGENNFLEVTSLNITHNFFMLKFILLFKIIPITLFIRWNCSPHHYRPVSNTVRRLRAASMTPVTYHLSPVTSHMTPSFCHMSHIIFCQLSPTTCYQVLLLVPHRLLRSPPILLSVPTGEPQESWVMFKVKKKVLGTRWGNKMSFRFKCSPGSFYGFKRPWWWQCWWFFLSWLLVS